MDFPDFSIDRVTMVVFTVYALVQSIEVRKEQETLHEIAISVFYDGFPPYCVPEFYIHGFGKIFAINLIQSDSDQTP